MIHLKENNLNRFKAVSIPSARKLFERLGFQSISGHPDNTDPDHFGEVSNPVGVDKQAVMARVGGSALRAFEVERLHESQREPPKEDVSDDLPAE